MGSGEQPGGSRDGPFGLEAGGEGGPACGTWRAPGSWFWGESITCLPLLWGEDDSCSSLYTDPSSAPSKGLGVVRRPSGLPGGGAWQSDSLLGGGGLLHERRWGPQGLRAGDRRPAPGRRVGPAGEGAQTLGAAPVTHSCLEAGDTGARIRGCHPGRGLGLPRPAESAEGVARAGTPPPAPPPPPPQKPQGLF